MRKTTYKRSTGRLVDADTGEVLGRIIRDSYPNVGGGETVGWIVKRGGREYGPRPTLREAREWLMRLAAAPATGEE